MINSVGGASAVSQTYLQQQQQQQNATKLQAQNPRGGLS